MKRLQAYIGPVPYESARCVFIRLFYCIGLALALAISPAFADDDPPLEHFAPHGVVLTPRSTLQVEQGELLFFVGRSRNPVAPRIWTLSEDGGVEFEVVDAAYRYHFHIQPYLLHINGEQHSAATIDISPRVDPGGDAPAIIWCGWRHSVEPTAPGTMQGLFLSDAYPSYSLQTHPTPWNETWTWFFEGPAFARERHVLYFVKAVSPWERTQTVRLDLPPYRDLKPDSLIGFTRLRLPSPSAENAALRVIVPIRPLDYEEYQAWRTGEISESGDDHTEESQEEVQEEVEEDEPQVLTNDREENADELEASDSDSGEMSKDEEVDAE